MSKVVDYYFAPHSPWSYLGHDRLVKIAQAADAKILIKPFDLGKTFGISGGLPLAKRSPQRQAYRLKEMDRWSKLLDIPMNLQPTHFPVPQDLASKVIIAAQLAHGTGQALDLTGAIMRGLWTGEKNIADADTLAAIATQLDMDGKNLLKSAETASVQAEYDRFTEEAHAINVFGAPWYVVDGEGYWGQDRLDFVERALAAQK